MNPVVEDQREFMRCDPSFLGSLIKEQDLNGHGMGRMRQRALHGIQSDSHSMTHSLQELMGLCGLMG